MVETILLLLMRRINVLSITDYIIVNISFCTYQKYHRYGMLVAAWIKLMWSGGTQMVETILLFWVKK